MKKFGLAALTLVPGIVSASAADLAARTYKAPPMAVAAVNDWSGFYAGGNVGGAWGTFDARTTTDFNPAPLGGPPVYNISNPATNVAALAAAGNQQIGKAAFTGGGQAGYNWQAGWAVFGIEADIDYFHLAGSATGTGAYATPAIVPPFTMTVNSAVSTDWLLTLRPRIGFASGNWLVYATGGLALTELHGNFTFTDTLGAALETGTFSATRAGWTVGGGAEVKVWEGWSLKAEYLYVDFGTVSTTSNNLVALGAAFPANIFHHSADLKANIARVGLNYHFGGPVVARY